MEIIGRQKEIALLEECYRSDKSEFVGLFGRRRVGKTFLIREVFRNRLTFHVTGKHDGSKEEQLKIFAKALNRLTPESKPAHPKNWDDAFDQLQSKLESMPKAAGVKRVLFFDELPWMVTPKSTFLSSLEHFWNDFAAWEHDIVLIICGSAASWMVDKIVDNHGGLHNRLTHRIHLMPFTLKETEEFLQKKGINWNRYQITECYMMMGGIPYYLDNIPTNGETPDMAIDKLFFTEGGMLREEYDNLYASLFSNAGPHVEIVEALATKNMGLSREEVIKATGMKDSGAVTKYLKDLMVCGFVRSYHLYGNKRKGEIYQLIDPFTLFYLRFIKDDISIGDNHWSLMMDNPGRLAWQGYAFEMVCMLHIDQIRQSLGFGAVSCTLSSWRTGPTEEHDGAQIDIVIDRRDHVINICEVKFATDEYVITASYEKVLRNKQSAFRIETKTRSALHLTMITPFGVRQNSHSSVVTSQVVLDGLFS